MIFMIYKNCFLAKEQYYSIVLSQLLITFILNTNLYSIYHFDYFSQSILFLLLFIEFFLE